MKTTFSHYENCEKKSYKKPQVHFDNGRGQSEQKKEISHIWARLTSMEKREKAYEFECEVKNCAETAAGNYCSLEDMNLTDLKTTFLETCNQKTHFFISAQCCKM